MSNSDSLTRRGAIRHRRWSAPNNTLLQVSITSADSADGSSDYGTAARLNLITSSVYLSRFREHTAVYLSRFREHTATIQPDSPTSIQQTPIEFLPGPTVPIPTSPVPSYHSVVLHNVQAAWGSVLPVRGPSRASTISMGSLPDYDKIEQGPPTVYPEYSNFIVPGMEMETDEEAMWVSSDLSEEEEIWINLDPSYWDRAPFVTDPTMPRCPGLADGTCPIHEAHNTGRYFLEQRAPSTLLVVVLTQHNAQHIFEGSCPPATVWAALLRRMTGSETEASKDLLAKFRWWHCPEYRARVIARRQPRIDIRQSSIYVRRVNQQYIQEWAQTIGEDETEEDVLLADQIRALDIYSRPDAGRSQQDDVLDLWDAYFDRDGGSNTADFEDSEYIDIVYDGSDERTAYSVSDIDSVSLRYSELDNNSATRDQDEYVDSTYFFLPDNLPRESYYWPYGFTLPSEDPMIVPPANLPSYFPCLSSLCPIRFPHPQGPFWDSGPVNAPTSLVPGPMAHLRAAPNLAAYLDALAEHGLGDLFGPETKPPMFILAAVERIIDGNPQTYDLRTVERFRYFHCRACRPVVMPDEEIEGHEEDDIEPPLSPSDQSEDGSDFEGEVEDDVMDSDDWAQFFD